MANPLIKPKSKAPEFYFSEFQGHTELTWNDFGEDWYCVTCYQTGTNYPTDTPQDKPCVPRDIPDDWNRTYG